MITKTFKKTELISGWSSVYHMQNFEVPLGRFTMVDKFTATLVYDLKFESQEELTKFMMKCLK